MSNQLNRYNLTIVNGLITGAYEYFDANDNAILPPNSYFINSTPPVGFATWEEFLENVKNNFKCCGRNEITRSITPYERNGFMGNFEGGNFYETGGANQFLVEKGCPVPDDLTIVFQGVVYIDGKDYPYNTNALPVPTTDTFVKEHIVAAMSQAIGSAGSVILNSNGEIELRGGDVDLAYTIRKGVYDANCIPCWDLWYSLRNDFGSADVDDIVMSPTNNPYDPISQAQGQVNQGQLNTI